MTNKKSTKRALLMSALSLLLCCSMLIGTTFAWFTDEVTSGVNQIIAGNLDVEVYNSLTVGEKKVDSTTKLFDEIKLWEPGVVAYENLTVANVGNLALKYQLSVNFENATQTPAGKTLADVLQVGFVKDGIKSTTREGALAEVKEWLPLASFAQNGELEKQNDSDSYGIVIWWEPSDNDNDYNMNNGQTTVLSIDLGIQLVATQLMNEDDSFGNDYDANAILPWDGSADTDWYTGDKDEYVLYTAEELAGLASLVNSGTTFSGKTVKLGADINLGGLDWTPIGQTGAPTFAGAFDGNGKTIYNLYIDNTELTEDYHAAGLFGWVEQHSGSNAITNLTIDGVTIDSYRYTGAVAGWINIPVTNCTVKNVTINCEYYNEDTDGTKVGALVGYANGGSALTGNTVENATINAYGDVGGLAGIAQTTVSVDGNTVKNVDIFYVSDAKSEPGELVSTRIEALLGTNTVEDVVITKAVTVTNADELKDALNSDADNISIILANDIAIDIGTGWKMGGAETESIRIRGAASAASRSAADAVVLTLSNTYRSYFNMANPEGTLYLDNLVLTNLHEGTHFFNFTTQFNCDLVATNVAFQKAPLTSSVTAVFNNCTFAEPVASYSLWIMAGSDVTVNGGSFNATRGIKIADEDTADAVTTLAVKDAKFNTTQKAAIVVASDMGANITLSNVNIENTVDTVHEVWVDEDYAASDAAVIVTGGEKIYEGNVVSNADELASAVAAGKTDLWLLDGEYDVANCKNATLTISGTKNAVIIHMNEGEQGCDYGFQGSNVTFNGVTIDTTRNTEGWAFGYARMNGTYNNCTINGTYFLYGVSKFENCEFNVSGNAYNIWTYGSSEATFTNCTFNCDGKSIYADGNGATGTKLTVTGCTFNDSTNGASGYAKAAIETGTTYGQTYELIISGVKVNGFGVNPDGIVTNSNIWANKHSMGTDKLNVVVDGTDVY